MSHIFISYSKKNRTYAYALADYLQDKGFNVWIDRIGIEYGVGWWDAIVEGLKVCGAFIVVMTPESKQSKWVMREVFITLDKKPIFPLLLTGENWELFSITQYADVRDGAMPDAELLARLGKFVTPRGKGSNQSNLTPEKQASALPTPINDDFDIDGAIADFGRFFRARQWSDALNILGRIRASGQDPTPFDPDAFERQVQGVIEEENRKREQVAYEAERSRQYGRMVTMSTYADAEVIWEALQKFWASFPDYDPDNLAERARPKPKLSRSLDLMPPPFAWVDIPAGRVTLEDGMGTHDVAAFAMAKYPVTNAQYAEFMKGGGYENEQWWTAAGWRARRDESWTKPRFWGNKDFNGPEQPVVGVSWYEAVAFCLWLSDATGEKIMLPTEQQWQWAAQGKDGREYPWGNGWDVVRANSRDSGHKKTTPVTTYEGKGDSSFGVVDMAGNAWEWCLTDYMAGTNDIDNNERPVLRGGSFLISTNFLRAAYRYYFTATNSDFNSGFRCSISY